MATDALTGAGVVLSSGAAIDALMASASVPPIFPPVRIGNRLLIDGGLADRTPISTAVAMGATRLFVLTTGFDCTVEAPPRGAAAVALQVLSLLIDRKLALDIERFRDAVELVVVPSLCPVDVPPYDFSHTGELIDRAEASTGEWIARGGLTSGRVRGPLHVPGAIENEESSSPALP